MSPQVNQEIKDKIRQEMLEENYTEVRLYEDPEYCAEHFSIQELADKFKASLNKANKYGHNFRVDDFIID